MFRTAVLAVLVAYASAQSLTTECTNALAGIATNPDAASCLSVGSLLPLATAGNSNTSIIAPINSWLTSLCGSPACTNATIAAVVQNVTTGCSTELAMTGFTSGMTGSITSLVQQYYPTVRKVICLKDGSTNCISQTLTNIEAVVGTLSVSNIIQIALTGPPTGTNVPQNLTCTNCVKEAYNVISKDVPSLVSDAAPSLQSQCGASFTDGNTPSGIAQSASDSTSTPSKAAALGAVSSLSATLIAGLSASGLVVISTIFTVLA